MSNDLTQAVESLRRELQSILSRAGEIKKTINQLNVMMGREPEFADVDQPLASGGLSNIRRDLFFGMSPVSAAREYLKMRGNAATAEEILDGLIRGGVEFPKDWKENLYLRNLAISLRKNVPRDFVYVKSSKAFGLWDFYPELKKERERKLKPGEKDEASEEIAVDVEENNQGDPEKSKA